MAGNSKKFKTQTGGLQEKKVKVEPTKEEIKQEIKEEKAKRKEKVKKEKADKPRFGQRFKDLFSELKRVKWPTAGQAFKQTGVVLGVVLVFAVVLFGINFGLTELFKLLTKEL
ncbi:MAG: preprotein translocase subunit SecE [Christensenellaceae bacterium]|jgi:preprotein translocase SecE subunit|nr:preprotein translocase subunit SecE [Christensenellaceae bacterium]